MRRFRLLAVAISLISIELASTACHKLGTGTSFIVYVKENAQSGPDQLWLPAGPQPWREWWQGQPTEPSSEGQFFRIDERDAVSGSYWSEANVYVLKGSKHKGEPIVESRLTIKSERSLMDEDGVVWRRSDMEVAEIQPWARPFLAHK
jgi:hypothetical protein